MGPLALPIAWARLIVARLAARALWLLASPGAQCELCHHREHIEGLGDMCGNPAMRGPGPDRVGVCKTLNRSNRCRGFRWED